MWNDCFLLAILKLNNNLNECPAINSRTFVLCIFTSPIQRLLLRREYNLAINNIQAFLQTRVSFASFFPSLVSQGDYIRRGNAGQGKCRGARHGFRNVGHAPMYNAIYFIDRFSMSAKLRDFETSALLFLISLGIPIIINV